MATRYTDQDGTYLTILTEEEYAQCAERDTPIVDGWLAESLGGSRFTGDYVAQVALSKRTAAVETRRRLSKLIADGFTVDEVHKFAAEQDAIADFCDAILAGKIEGQTVSAF